MRSLVLWLLAVMAAPLWAQAPFDARDLSATRNHLSNSSFEAAAEGVPASFIVLSCPQFMTLSSDRPLHGRVALRLTVPTGSPTGPLMRQDVPGCGRCTYALSGWVQVLQTAGGQVALALEALDSVSNLVARQQTTAAAVTAGWQPLSVQLLAPETTDVMRVTISATAGMNAQLDALSLQVIKGPRRRKYGPRIVEVAAPRVGANWALLRWSGPRGKYEIRYRHPTRHPDPWQVIDGLTDFHQPLFGLEPETTYEVRTRLVWDQYLNELGEPAEPPVQPTPPEPLTFTTTPWQPRQAGLLRIWPTRPLPGLPGPGANPRLAAHKERLYVAREYAGGIHLSKVNPEPLEVEWTRELVVPLPDALPAQLEDMTVFTDILWVIYRQGESRFLLPFNLELEETGEPAALALGEPPWQTEHAALGVAGGRLWVLWVNAAGAGDCRQGILRVAPWDQGTLGTAQEWRGEALPYPGQPSAAAFGDELMIGFTDVRQGQLTPGREPLYLVSFNGQTFRRLRTLRDVGCNCQSQGTQLGPSFYLVFTGDAAYVSYGGRYRDLLLTIIPPDRLGLETVTYLEDQQYNRSPDIAALGSALWVVHEKLDHQPEEGAAEPVRRGVFIGRIDFGAPAGQ